MTRTLTTSLHFAVLETVLAYATGALPRADWPGIFSTAFVIWLTWGLAIGLASHLLPSSRLVGLLGDFAYLVAPPLAFAARAPYPRAAFSLAALQWLLTLTFAAAVLLFLRRAGPLSDLRFAVVATLSQTAGAIGLLARDPRSTLDAGQPGAVGIAGPSILLMLASVGVAALAAQRGSLPRGREAYLLPWLHAAGAVALAYAAAQHWGSVTPTLGPGRPGAAAAAGGAAFNVILVTIDTARSDHFSSYGYPRATTPHLDRLATRAVRFQKAYATSSHTLASHASLFTGLMPSRHGARLVDDDAESDPKPRVRIYPLSTEARTLAERLAERGYRTAAVVANSAGLAPRTGLARGFEVYDWRSGRQYGYVPLVVPVARRAFPEYYDSRRDRPARHAQEITDAALELLQGLRGRRFLLFVNYMDTHWPYQPPQRLLDRFASPAVSLTWQQLRGWPNLAGRLTDRTAGFREAVVARYDAGLAFVDEQLGRLMESLEAQGRLQDTIVVVTSDHGEAFGEHGFVLHYNSLYEEEVRIPLLLWWPGAPTGGQVWSEPVGLDDLPGMLESLLDGFSGVELGRPGPRLRGEMWLGKKRQSHGSYLRSALSEPFKMIEDARGRTELYDLTTDPGERRDLAGDPRYQQRIRDLLNGLPPPPSGPRSSPVEISPEEVERLRSLGYLR